MINYKHVLNISPSHHYIGINFALIKNSLPFNYKKIIDYGSIIAVVFDNYFLTIDQLGHITIYFNDDIDLQNVRENINELEHVYHNLDYPLSYSMGLLNG